MVSDDLNITLYWPYEVVTYINYTESADIITKRVLEECSKCEDGLPLFGYRTRVNTRGHNGDDLVVQTYNFYDDVHDLLASYHGISIIFHARLPRDEAGMDITIYKVKPMKLTGIIVPAGIETDIEIVRLHYYFLLKNNFVHRTDDGITTFSSPLTGSACRDYVVNSVSISPDIVVPNLTSEAKRIEEVALLKGL